MKIRSAMPTGWFRFLLLLPVLLPGTEGYPNYQSAIPNGNRVPHPCVSGQAWLGVGHTTAAGGGDRNPFGRHFHQHGMKWTSELCRLDSDGDGRSNGQELGDPDCAWKEGEDPHTTAHITHPGICEPVNSPGCAKVNDWLKCMPGNFDCDAFEDKDLRNWTVRLPPTPVPAEVTTYSCMLFEVPVEDSFHLVAAQPVLNNTRVVHHMLLFGCREGRQKTLEASSQPYRCEMVPHVSCQEVILTWTIGLQGDCLHNQAGFRLGRHGYRFVALQVHWNNPTESSDLLDSSGLVLHYTPNLRKYDAGILVFGHIYLQVDPLTASEGNISEPVQTYTSTCPQHCLREMFNSTIYITTAINHMHKLGKHQLVELLRGGEKVQDLSWDPQFVYDSPVAHRLTPPVALHPGDEIRTTCTFRKPRSGNPVCYGQATSDEMCFGFITYFPLQPSLQQPWCTSRRSMISCERTLPALWDRPINNCSWRRFIRPPSPEAVSIIRDVLGACYTPSSGQLQCSGTCRYVLSELRKHPCFVDDLAYYMVAKIREYTKHGDNFARAWFTCNCDREFDYCERLSKDGVLGQDQAAMCRETGAITEDGSERLGALLSLVVTCVILVAGREVL